MTSPIQKQVADQWSLLLEQSNIHPTVREGLVSAFANDTATSIDELLVLIDAHSGEESA